MTGPRKGKLSPSNDQEQVGEIKATLNTHTEWLSTISGEMKQMNVNFAKYNEQLEIHIDRTNKLESLHIKHEDKLDVRLAPIEKHVTQVSLIAKLLITFLALPAAVFYIAQLIRMLMGKI